jgi:hypothetical protein
MTILSWIFLVGSLLVLSLGLLIYYQDKKDAQRRQK